MTRWSKKDLTGQIIKSSVQRSGEEWEVIEFPAILPTGNSLWPEFWPLKELEVLRNELPNANGWLSTNKTPHLRLQLSLNGSGGRFGRKKTLLGANLR